MGSKRAAAQPAADRHVSKKAKQSRQELKPAPPPAAAFDSSDEDASSSEAPASLDKGKQRAVDDEESDLDGSFEDLEDDEAKEFEMGDEEDGGSDDLIGDDGEDLHAHMDDIEDDGEDSESAGSDSETEETAPPAPAVVPLKKANVRNSRAPKPLTPAELRALAFAELTASPISSVISTQVGALLDPVTPSPPSTSPLQPLLKALHAHITALPSKKPTSLAALRKKGQTVPPVEGADGKWAKQELAWEKPRPEDVRVMGRWAYGAGIKIKGEYVVEMAIAMPAALLQPKDYLFPRFSVKATHYLVQLASQLPALLGPVALTYTRLPASRGYVLDVRSAYVKGTEKVGLAKAKGAVLRISIASPADAFAASKLSPSSNVIRPATSVGDGDQVDPSSLPATPLHTTSLHHASLPLILTHLKYHHALATKFPSYSSAVRLLQLWASKRFHGATLGISDDWWAWCVARALGGSSAGDVASAAAGGEAWASWRRTVEWLAGANWTEGVFFKTEGSQTHSKDAFKQAFQGRPLFVDPTGTVNLAAGIDLSALEMLKQDAKTTISLLLTSVEDESKFTSCFLRELREVERFDNYARISLKSLHLDKLSAADQLDYPDKLSAAVASISATLRRALGSRTHAFQLVVPPPPVLPVKGISTSAATSLVLGLGVLLDPAHSMRVVDHGPSAEDEAACAEFSAFWGPKSELRRFKDGSIVETVVWDEMGPDGLGPQRHTVVGRIIKYILNHRFGLGSSDVEVFSGTFDPMMVEPLAIRRAIYLDDSVATGRGFSNVTNAFDELSKEMRALSDLPLVIASIAPAAPALRYSTAFTPCPRRLKAFQSFPDSTKYIEAHDMHLTLESSGRWPEDLEGVQKIKAAFLTKMGEQLQQSHTIVQAKIVFDLDARPVDDNVALEVLTASGYAFRARIFYERSLLLHRERVAQLGASAKPALETYKRRFEHLPRHHAAIATVQQHFPSYSHTVRLAKRWFSTHMLLSHFHEEQIEILTASTFIDPSSPFEPAQSGATGFARVMDKLASWKWRDEPLCVPLYTFQMATTSSRRAAFPPAKRVKAQMAFEALRLSDPAINEHAWVIATEEDSKGRVWGSITDKVVAARVRSLAKATLNALQEGVVEGGLVVQQLYTPPLADYPFVIHLDPSVVPRHFQSLSPDGKALASSPRSTVLSGTVMGEREAVDTIRLAWDPVAEFVREVEALFPSTFLLFYSTDGAPTLGGVWNPSAEGARPFKVGLGFPIAPVVEGEAKPKVALDKAALLKQVERLGKGLVRKIEMR